MSECVTTWVGGLTCDHIYADCPNYRRGLPELAAYGWDTLGGNGLDPHGTDVCGMCLHRHNRKYHRGDT